MDRDRQVRYNYRRSKNNPELNEWWILIINQNREIEEIKQRIYSLFESFEDEWEAIEGIVTGTGLRYELINFETRKKVEELNIKGLYKRIVMDAKLYDRKHPDGLSIYLASWLNK